MSSNKTQQDALVKSAEQIEKLVQVVAMQHGDNAKIQKRMYWLTLVVAVSAAVQAIIALFK